MVVKYIMNQRGASLVEYSLLVSLIAILAIGGVSALGTYVTKPFCVVTGAIVHEGDPSTYDWIPDNVDGKPDCIDRSTGFDTSVWY